MSNQTYLKVISQTLGHSNRKIFAYLQVLSGEKYSKVGDCKLARVFRLLALWKVTIPECTFRDVIRSAANGGPIA